MDYPFNADEMTQETFVRFVSPDPLLPGTASPALLLQALRAITLGHVPGITSDIAHLLCGLIGDAAGHIGWESLAYEAYIDAELYFNDAAAGLGMDKGGRL